MYFGRGIYWGFDWTYLLLVIGMLLSMAASAGVKSTYASYSRVRSRCGLTGAQVAERILYTAGVRDVSVRPVKGSLTDHYDPRTKQVCLSESVYGSNSLAALGVAAHECGHAIQHQKEYLPLTVRSMLVPAANFGSSLSWPIFLAGLILQVSGLLTLGIVLFSLAVLFQLVTLPVEFDASSRALRMLESFGILGNDEIRGTRKVLRAAALTYVAALAASVLQLLRLVILAGGRKNRD